MEEQAMEESLESKCNKLRGDILSLGKIVFILKQSGEVARKDEFVGQRSEQIANIMLAYRHLEDARMRLGKVMQQCQGGVSIFDK